MSEDVKRSQWPAYFSEFSKRNQSRATRLEIFGEMGAQEEERYLPLNGISVDETGPGAPLIEIMLGGGARHLTHTIAQATRVIPKTADDGHDEALEIEDAKGDKTLLRFESLPKLSG